MMQLLIGGNGLIGTAVRREMERRYLTGTGPPFRVTTRRESDADDGWILYRLGENPDQLPPATVVYLVAAKPGFAACEGSAESWVVNVDAQIAIARRFKRMAFVVYVSSDAVETCGVTAYARQKAQVESYIQSINGAIVRPTRVSAERAGDLASLFINVGLARNPGVYRWKP
jgi:dTDP-4-dehydrorhamnose reductase